MLKSKRRIICLLNKDIFSEMKAFPSPPEAVLKVGAAVLCLMPPGGGKVPRPNQRDWKACKANMGNVDQFLRKDLFTKISFIIKLYHLNRSFKKL